MMASNFNSATSTQKRIKLEGIISPIKQENAILEEGKEGNECRSVLQHKMKKNHPIQSSTGTNFLINRNIHIENIITSKVNQKFIFLIRIFGLPIKLPII